MTPLSIPVSFGEAADKLSILQIKQERIRDPARLASIQREIAPISEIINARAAGLPAFAEVFRQLKQINERLWEIEDRLREHERRQDFGVEFVGLARAVYLANDKRFRVKRSIDELFDSPIREEKSYGEYAADDSGGA